MEIKIPYKPRKWAKELHEATERWIMLVLHRRAGKTTAGLNHLQRDALKIPKSQWAYIGPTYKQSKRIAWDIAITISQPIPEVIQNVSELTIIYPNGSKLILVGSDNPDALRGMGLWGAFFDEYPLQPSNVFSEIVSKCLADHLGYAIFGGTPKGKGEFWRMYNNSKNNPEWRLIYKTIEHSLKEETGETIDNLRNALEGDRSLVRQGLMTEDELNQEWYCSFEAAIRGAYYAKQISEAREQKRLRIVPYDSVLRVHTVWDLGIGQAMGIGFYQRSGLETRMIDYWEGLNQEGIPQAIRAIQNKPYIYGKHFAPHDINAKDIGTGKTRKETATSLGINFEVIPSLTVDDGINRGKLMWNHLWIDEQKCEVWLDYISQYKQEWDDDKKMFRNKPAHDFTSHAADVHRYAAIVEDQMKSEIDKPYKQKPHQSLWEVEG